MINLPHPYCVTPCKVIIHGNHMHAFSRKCIQIDRARGGKRLSFSSKHFGDLPRMKHDSPDKLDVKVTLSQCAATYLANQSKRLWKNAL